MLSHRGPDNQQFVNHTISSHKYFLGHTRLSIIDLSESANQPFYSQSGKTVIIYNGEIYNYRELRAELEESHSIQFKTRSDTELLIEAFELVGPEFVNRLNGMFAFSILNLEDGKMYLFRDRLGIKPLYYLQDETRLTFSSELKSIRKVEQGLEINKAAIYEFLHLGYIPEPHTIYSQVQKFPAGSYGVLEDNTLSVTRYWDSSEHFESNFNDSQDPKEELKSLLHKSVKRRLLADVPVGTFLSGGIDSSLITAIASKEFGSSLPTFHVSFEDSAFDESEYASKIAGHLGTEHTEVHLKEQDALDLVEDILPQFDEPFADSSAIPTMLVSKVASQKVKVSLSGDGGDELFMGYGMYNWARRLANPAIRLLRSPIYAWLGSSDTQRKQRASWLFADDGGNRMSHIFSQEQYLFAQTELKESLLNDTTGSFKVQHFPSRSDAENQAFFDLNYYLKDDLLTKVDRASMKYSLEVRVPLLDHEIVEYALRLPEKWKVNKGDSKFILKKVLADYLPEEFYNRQKWGFSIPLSRWLNSELKYLQDTFLDDKIIEKWGVVNPDYVTKLKDKFQKGNEIWYNRIWALIILHRWLEENG